MLGTSVGTYRITGSIGKGGMGVVYLAEHALLGRPAAVKVLLPEFSQNQEIVTRFFNEARAATAIRHPGIVEIYDFGFHRDGAAYIVMEYLQGESLAARMSRGRMPVASALGIIRQIAGALSAAHAKGIVHRDLKPDNVYLVPDPEVPGGERIKLLDFGIAKLAVDNSPGQKTRTGAVIGTPTYMAPEQCRGVHVDQRADLYSLGCILYEMLTGRPPFVGEGVGDVLAAHIHVAPQPASSMNPEVDPAVEHLVQRMLVKDPRERVQSCEEVIHAIDAAIGNPTYRTGPRTTGGQVAMRAMTHEPTTLSGAAVTHPSVATGGGSRVGLWIGVGVAAVAGIVVIAIVAGSGKGAGADKSGAAQTPGSGSVAQGPGPEQPKPEQPKPEQPKPEQPKPEQPKPEQPKPEEPKPEEPKPEEPKPEIPAAIAVTIEGTPANAEVFVMGRTDPTAPWTKHSLGKVPLHTTLPAGLELNGQMVISATGYKDQTLTVDPQHEIAASVKLEKKRSVGGGGGGSRDRDRDRGVNPFGN